MLDFSVQFCHDPNMKSLFSRSSLLLVLVSTFALSGCTLLNKKGLSNPVDNATKEAIIKLTEENLKDVSDPLVRKHLIAQYSQQSYRIKSTSSGKGEGTSITEIKMGDKMQMHSYQEMKGQRSQEMIIIGDVTYVKDSKGSWWKQTNKPGSVEEINIPLQKPEEIDKVIQQVTKIEYKQLGTESCGQLTCYKYQEVNKENPESARTFWFDNKDYLMRKDNYAFGEFSSTNEYEYTNVTIDEPASATEVPEGKSVYEYLVDFGSTQPSGVSSEEGQKMPSKAELEQMMEDVKKFQQSQPETDN